MLRVLRLPFAIKLGVIRPTSACSTKHERKPKRLLTRCTRRWPVKRHVLERIEKRPVARLSLSPSIKSRDARRFAGPRGSNYASYAAISGQSTDYSKILRPCRSRSFPVANTKTCWSLASCFVSSWRCLKTIPIA